MTDQPEIPALAAQEKVISEHTLSLHVIGEQLGQIESWFWAHLADVREAARQELGGPLPDDVTATPPPEAASAPQAPDGQPETADSTDGPQAPVQGSALREQIAAAIQAVQDGQAAPVEIGDERIADAVLAAILPHGKLLGDMYRESEAELMKALEALARVQALIAEHPVAVGTHLLEEALDQPKEPS